MRYLNLLLCAIPITALRRSELMRYFDDQIRDQEWGYDSGWNGATTSGSVWIKTVSDGTELVGMLRITQASDEVFNIRFTVVTVDPAKHYSGRSSTVNSI